jgi:hypothetical protein
MKADYFPTPPQQNNLVVAPRRRSRKGKNAVTEQGISRFDRLESIRMETQSLLESFNGLHQLIEDSTPDESKLEVRQKYNKNKDYEDIVVRIPTEKWFQMKDKAMEHVTAYEKIMSSWENILKVDNVTEDKIVRISAKFVDRWSLKTK